MVTALGADAHLLQREADLAPYVLAPVLGGDVHVARVIVGYARGLPVLVPAEDVKLHLRAEGEAVARVLGLRRRLAQERAGVGLEGATVGVFDVAEHAHHLAVLRPPGQFCKRFRLGVQQQVRAHLAAEARDGRGIDGYARAKGPLQLRGHDGDVLLPAVYVAEGQAHKLDVLLLRVLDYLFRRIFHVESDLSGL